MNFHKNTKKASSPTIHRHEALQCIPVINSSVQILEMESGEILLEYPLHVKPLLQAIFERFQKNKTTPTKKLQLDEMGSVVWKQIDGHKNAQTIITYFADTYGITLQEAEKSVTTFLVDLGRRGIIAMS